MKSFSTVRDTWRGTQNYTEKRRGRKEIEVTRRRRGGIKRGESELASNHFPVCSPDVQTGFRKGRRTRDQIANICWIIEKARKTTTSALIDYAKAFDCVDHVNYGKFWKKWEYQTTWPAPWETCVQVRKQQLEPNMEQRTGSKLVPQGYIFSPYSFNFICKACMCMLSHFSHVWLFATLWTVACQAPLSRGSSHPRDGTQVSTLQADSFPLSYKGNRVHHAKCQAGLITNWIQDCQEKHQ